MSIDSRGKEPLVNFDAATPIDTEASIQEVTADEFWHI